MRNAFAHSRTLSDVTRKEGEAAILWFGDSLRDVVVPSRIAPAILDDTPPIEASDPDAGSDGKFRWGPDTTERGLDAEGLSEVEVEEVLNALRDRVPRLGDDIVGSATKGYLAFDVAQRRFVIAGRRKTYVKLHLILGETVEDPGRLLTLQPSGDDDKRFPFEAAIRRVDELDSAIALIAQAYAHAKEQALAISADSPWLLDGRRWHLEERCSPATRQIVETLVDVISEVDPGARGPLWSQKRYIVWKGSGDNVWVRLQTFPLTIWLDIFDLPDEPTAIAEELEGRWREGREDDASGPALTTFRKDSALRLAFTDVRQVAHAGISLESLLRDSWKQFVAAHPLY